MRAVGSQQLKSDGLTKATRIYYKSQYQHARTLTPWRNEGPASAGRIIKHMDERAGGRRGRGSRG